MKRFFCLLVLVVAATTLFVSCGQEAEAKKMDAIYDNVFSQMTWEEILEEADGQTVNWYLWGGSTAINDMIDNEFSAEAAKYGVKINRVGVNNITEAINTIISEKEAGKTSGGSVDLLWVNGANFRTMVEADITLKNWAEEIPSSEKIDWSDPAIAYDMGYPVNGQEAPWSSAQLQIVYDSARVQESDLPRTYDDFMTYAKANPGRVTYLAPPEFMGTRFIKQGMYELTGGHEQYNRDGITKDELEVMSEPMWQWLEEINPYLWSNGETYAKSGANAYELVNNGEVDFAFTMNGTGINSAIELGQLPETAKVYCTETSIADTSYVGISFNGANKAGAIVLANVLTSPEMQAKKIGIGQGTILNFSTLSADQQAAFDVEYASLPEGTYVDPAELARTKSPEVGSYLNILIEEIWAERIGNN